MIFASHPKFTDDAVKDKSLNRSYHYITVTFSTELTWTMCCRLTFVTDNLFIYDILIMSSEKHHMSNICEKKQTNKDNNGMYIKNKSLSA